MMLLIPVLIVAAVLLARWCLQRSELPAYKGEGKLSFLSDAEAYIMRPIELVNKATAQCGRVFSIQVLTIYNVWLRGNDLNKVYLETKEDIWSFGAGMGIFLQKILDPGYLPHLKTMVGSVAHYINRAAAQEYVATCAVEETQKQALGWTTNTDIELFDSVAALVHKVFVKALMGEDFYQHSADELFDLLHAMEEDIGSPFSFLLPDWVPHPPARRLHAARERMKAIFFERLSQRAACSAGEKASEAQDYITYTLNDHKTAHLRDLLPSHHTALLFAAHTSTVSLLAWTIVSMIRRPEIMRAVQKDLRSGTSSPLLQACIKETNRYYCGIKCFRLALKKTCIPGTDINVPKGALVSISPYLTHHDPANYADPDAWLPERWLPEAEPRLQAPKGVSWMPFGAGAHRCPGEKVALILVTKALGTLLRDYDVKFPQGQGEVDFERLDFDKIGSPWLKGGVRVKVERREWPETMAGC